MIDNSKLKKSGYHAHRLCFDIRIFWLHFTEVLVVIVQPEKFLSCFLIRRF